MTEHMHRHESQKKLLHRMNYLIGHLNGVKKMIEQDAYCIDIINQNLGVIAAIKKVNEQVLAKHLEHCLVLAIRGEDVAQRAAKLNEIRNLISKVS